MELNECITIFKDFTIAIAAGVTAYAAYSGINKWKQELSGKVEFDTARELMRIVYKLREELKYVRNPVIFSYEFPEGNERKSPEEKADANAYIYGNRMKQASESLQELDLLSLEAEALWGKNIKEKMDEFRGCYFKLQSSLQFFIDDIRDEGSMRRDNKKIYKEIKNDIYLINKEDSLTIKIRKSIEDIEDIVRPHLNKK